MKRRNDTPFILTMLLILLLLSASLFMGVIMEITDRYRQFSSVDTISTDVILVKPDDINLTSGISNVIYGNEDINVEENDLATVKESIDVTPAMPIEVPIDNKDRYEVLYASTRVNIRREPNDKSEIIYTLSKGDSVKIYGDIKNDVWSWTIKDNEKLYICNAYLSWEKPKENDYTDAELDLLAHLVFSESGTLGEQCMLYTGSVVLNRVNSQYFPNTLHDVVYQNGQYQVTWNGDINKEPSKLAYEVAERLLKYGSALPANVLWQAEFSQGDGLYTQVGNTKFCYSNNY